MNINLLYLYRDAANYKRHESVTLSNSSNLSLATIDEKIRTSLIEGEWFYANKWGLPDLHFDKWDGEIDHEWHEYGYVEETKDADVAEDITSFLERIREMKS